MHPLWSRVHDERQALISDLTQIPAERWEEPSWAPGWTIHDVAAHLVDNARTTPLRLLRAMAAARFDFDRQNDDGMRRHRGQTPETTLAALQSVAGRTTGPPTFLAAVPSRLVEEIAHGEDIRRPLGLQRDYPPEALIPAIEHLANTPAAMGGGKERAAAKTIVATDAPLRWGTGPEIRGTALTLLLWLSGRPVEEELDGQNVDGGSRGESS